MIRKKAKRQELAPIISNFLFHSPEDSKNEQKEYVELKIEIREYLNNKTFRKIISQILFDLQKDVAGGTRERLFKLYKELELHHDSFQKLESWRWETVAQGILELSQMEVEESYQLIRKFINDRRGVVRKQAELATISLRPDGIEYLLDTTKHSISEWQQLKLMEVLGKRKNYRPPQFKGWLLSQNRDVVLFTLRLIKHYNQKGAEPSIRELVKHKNDEVKIAAIHCIMDFHFVSAIAVLKKVFWNSSNTVKINILNAVALLGTKEDISFLQKVAEHENSFIIVGKAQSTINAIAPERILPSKDIIAVEIEETTHTGEIKESCETPFANGIADEIPSDDPMPQSIEVEDMEFFDEVEFSPSQPQKDVTEPYIPAFELNPIEDEYGNAMDHLLGLVSSNDKDFDSKDLFSGYDSITPAEKSKLVGMMGESADERELPLLEHITENETDSELRFQAFKTIQSIKNKSDSLDKNQENTEADEREIALEKHSIFHPLYHHTDDLDAKLILIKELAELRDQRDIPFLKSLLSEEHRSIVKAAQKAIHLLKIDDMSDAPVQTDEETIEFQKDTVQTIEVEGVNMNQDERIPMELFLLYEELGIESAQEADGKLSPFDFELAPEFFSGLNESGNPAKKSNE